MNKAIVTTTINPPTKAILKFLDIAERDDWHIFVVGDLKTPHDSYKELEQSSNGRLVYIDPQHQESIDRELSNLIGWNCIQRRNFGFIVAYNQGADIIATIDDDNIPYDNWGKDLLVGQSVDIEIYDNAGPVYNPLARHDFGYQGVNICMDPEQLYTQSLWHRGVPEEQIETDSANGSDRYTPVAAEERQILVQADMWNGDPDISAVARMVLHPTVKFTHDAPYAGAKAGPFNSQNTFVHRSVMPDYFMFPHIGRMDDIWASYYLQAKHGNVVAYGLATVFQDRNEHDLSKDLENELIGYKHSRELYQRLFDNRITEQATRDAALQSFIGDDSFKAFQLYRGLLHDEKAPTHQ